MSKDTFKMNQPPKPEIFVTEELAHNYNLAKSEYITDCYFYGSSTKIYTFATIMHEELKYGFMHYHIPKNHHAYFSEKYPELANKYITSIPQKLGVCG